MPDDMRAIHRASCVEVAVARPDEFERNWGQLPLGGPQLVREHGRR